MKKRKIANLIMVAIIVAVSVSGILGVGHIKGWFDKSDEKTAVLTEFRGIITLQRDGVAYATTEDTVLREGDKILCDHGATVKIALGENYLVLGQDADAEIINPSVESFILKMNLGETFVNTNDSVSLEFANKKIGINNAVANLSVRKGAQSISVYYGSVNDAKSGEMIEWIGDEESVRKFSIKSLNDFNILQIRKVNETKALVFSNDDLDKLENERWEQMHGSTETITETETSARTEKTTSVKTTAKKEPTTTVAETTAKPTTSKAHTTTEKAIKKRATTTRRNYFPDTTTSTTAESTTETTIAENTTKPKSTTTTTTEPVNTTTKPTTTKPAIARPVETTKEKLTCTITIRCDTILDNMDNLDPAKAPYVPDNGVILREVTVEFEEGETVFEVLNRVCKQYNIQIEYSWTPMYDSYYIEGINNLYEFDCGSESGWMYKVNGWFPNYGCSSYYLTGGETIVWCYTCNGLGEDVGAERWE